VSTTWPDVVAHPAGGFLTAIGDVGTGKIEVFHDGVFVGTLTAPTDWLRFLRLRVSPSGAFAVIGQGGEGLAWLLRSDATVTSLGQTYGMNPVALNFDGETLHTYRCGPGDFVPLYLDDVQIGLMHAVEGIREVLADGTIQHGQATAAAVIQGHNFGQFTRKDGWVVGQSGNSIACLHEASGTFFTARRGPMAEGIHFAVQGARIAVCALTEAGAWVDVFQAPYPVDPIDPKPICATVYTVGDTGPCPICGHDKSVHALKPKPEEPMPTVPNYVEYVKVRAAQFPDYTNDDLTDEQRVDAAAKLTAIVAHDIHFGKNGAPRDPRVGLFRKGNKYGFDENRLDFYFPDEDVTVLAKIVIQTGAAHASIGWTETEKVWPDGRGDFIVPPPVPGVHTPTDPTDPPAGDHEARLAALEASDKSQWNTLQNLTADYLAFKGDVLNRLSVLETAPPGSELTPAQKLTLARSAQLLDAIGKGLSTNSVWGHAHVTKWVP